MAHHKILTIRHSCLNSANGKLFEDTDKETYLFTLNCAPEKCLECNERLDHQTTNQLIPPVTNAHISVLFPSSPIARIAFISSDGNKILNYHPDVNLHCGAVDSTGMVYNFTSQLGVHAASNGWEESVVINVAGVSGCCGLTSSKWDENIYRYVNNQEWFVRNTVDRTYDCLDFVVDLINDVTNSEKEVDRSSVAEWLSTYLERIMLHADILRSLESGSSQVIRGFHKTSTFPY
ncbi:unnamed protein product [Heterobilharzia americana]|nr:unnamed protein product [Heterobilharzia americana]CAH8512638.1 unnamed protein product [Heterobilharzia americana]